MSTAFDELISRGTKAAAKAARVEWTAEEWLDIARRTYERRRRKPTFAIVTLVNKVQEQLPKNRQRKGLTTQQIKPIVDFITKWETEATEAKEKVATLEARVAELEQRQTRDQVLASLTESELLRLKDRFFAAVTPLDVSAAFTPADLLSGIESADLAGEAVRRVIRDLQTIDFHPTLTVPSPLIEALMNHHPNGNGNGNGNGKHVSRVSTKKHIVFLGLRPVEQQKVAERLRDVAVLCFVTKDRHTPLRLPEKIDHCFVVANNTSRNDQQACKDKVTGSNLTFVRTGVSGLIQKAIAICG